MRRAIIATAGTVAALVAILEYKSSGTDQAVPVAVPSAPAGSSTPAASSGSSSSGSSSSRSSSSSSSASVRQFQGQDVRYQYGEIEVGITVEGKKISAIHILRNTASDPQSESINSQAVPVLVEEALAAQSIHFDVVSGATYTSEAFAQTLQAALSKAGK